MPKKTVARSLPIDPHKLRALGREVQAARFKLDVSAKSVADAVGCSPAHLHHFESAYSWLSMPVYLRVRDALGMEKLT